MTNHPSAERLHEVLHYDPATGFFTWRYRKDARQELNTQFAGKRAGRTNKGYIEICIDGKRHLAHRLAWLYVHGRWPSNQIDHINCDRADNRIDNLRLATNAENMRNAARRSDNTSGFKGVARHKAAGRWQAYIDADGKRHSLGLFDLPEQAHAAYCEAALALHGKFSRTE